MKRVLFLSIFLLAGIYSFAQMQELEENRPPMFDHPTSKYGWGNYVINDSRKSLTHITGDSVRNLCMIDKIIIECKLTKEGKLTNIQFSENTPKFIKNSILINMNDSEQYWKPKKIRGKYVDAKLVFVWGVFFMEGCKTGNIEHEKTWEYHNQIWFKKIEREKIIERQKYKNYDYKEEFDTGRYKH